MNRFLPGVLVVLSTGCQTGTLCTLDAAAGVVVVARDASTGDTITSGLRGAVHEGSHVDSLRPAWWFSDDSVIAWAGAYERSGTYRLELVHAGHADYSQSGIRVGQGECHVVTRQMTVEMKRASAP